MKKTLTIEEAKKAIEAAGYKSYTTHDGIVTFYDPSKRGACIRLEGGYCNAQYSEYPCVEDHKGKCSGRFHAEIRQIIDGLMK